MELAQAELIAQALLFIVAQAEQHRPPEQVRHRVGRAERIPLDLGPRIRLLEAGVLDEEPRGLLQRDLTAVHAHVEDDPARPPDRVRVEDQAEARIVVEAVLAHHEL